MTPDKVNSLFVFVGALLIWRNLYRLYIDQEIKGVSLIVSAFFSIWSVWNLYYYHSLNQPISLMANILLSLGNTSWLCFALWLKIRRKMAMSW